jgi:hypothetical protein
MTDTLAYQIGAMFFLAVLFMAGTLTRGLFPKDIFKSVKLTALVVAVLLVGFVMYRRRQDISSVLDFTPSGSTPIPVQGAPAPGVAIKKGGAPRPATKAREVQTIRQTPPALDATPRPQETPNLVAGPQLPAVSPPQSDAFSPPGSVGEGAASAGSRQATPALESGNRVKRAIKSVGHFLHIGHEKYQPLPSVPQSAAPIDPGKADGAQ